MKRPQFSIRLMLLVLALAATLSGWRFWVERTRQEVRAGSRYKVGVLTRSQLNLDLMEWKVALIKSNRVLELYASQAEDYSIVTGPLKEQIKNLEDKIAAGTKMIDDLPK